MNSLTDRILYCDGSCVVVNKIAGEAVEGAGSGMIDLPRLLADELAVPNWPAALPEEHILPLPTAVHRLDVPVSGCVVFARTNNALVFLNNAFRNNAVKKFYRAIVEPPENKDCILPQTMEEFVHWIQFNPKKNRSFAHDTEGLGRKKAILRCRQSGRGENYLFFEIELVTGRPHQIRAQFERLGLCIKGDLKYGAKRSEKGGGIRLHAHSISFPNPADINKRITVQCDPPLKDNLWLAFENGNANDIGNPS